MKALTMLKSTFDYSKHFSQSTFESVSHLKVMLGRWIWDLLNIFIHLCIKEGGGGLKSFCMSLYQLKQS